MSIVSEAWLEVTLYGAPSIEIQVDSTTAGDTAVAVNNTANVPRTTESARGELSTIDGELTKFSLNGTEQAVLPEEYALT